MLGLNFSEIMVIVIVLIVVVGPERLPPMLRTAGRYYGQVKRMRGAFRRALRRNGYFAVKSTLEVSVKVNAVQVPKGFYDETNKWHITYGDSDQDR